VNQHDLERLRALTRRVRERIIDIVHGSGSGHVGAALSQADALALLYGKWLRVDAARPDWPERDRFVLSKGHGGLGLAAVLAEVGLLDPAELADFGKSGHRLGMHMDRLKVPAIEASTGSLGHGLGQAVGMALGARIQRQGWRTWCLLSDGEQYEGSVWEAALAGGGFRLGRLVAIVDRNGLTMDGPTEEELPLEPLADKWRSFGWRALEVDGHDLDALDAAYAQACDDAAPTVIIARTVKGKGVDFMEGEPKWHYGALDSETYARALASVRRG
jgi:transketolase